MRILGDIKAAQEAAAAHTGSVLLPPTMPALPEEQAWNMIAAEGGAMAVLLAIGVTVLWRMVSRILTETREQNKTMMGAQTTAINLLSESMVKVQVAVRESDINNTHAIGRLSDTVSAATARIDRHDTKIEAHHESIQIHSHRLQALESGTLRIQPPVPARRWGQEP